MIVTPNEPLSASILANMYFRPNRTAWAAGDLDLRREDHRRSRPSDNGRHPARHWHGHGGGSRHRASLALDREAGGGVVQPFTEVPGKTRLAYIEGPDVVLIELNQPYS